ncbi:MAG: lytic transglycosylase domain-containing protein [Firmicutes bacterium]|nr:lytic transglycosylase domain-containing protein [Bacillota bacterium]
MGTTSYTSPTTINKAKLGRAGIALILVGVIALSIVASIFIFISLFPLKHREYVQTISAQFEVDEALVFAVIKAESNFKQNAVSNAGAVGLMQIMPSTARYIGARLNMHNLQTATNAEIVHMLKQPQTNILLGVYYISYLKQRFNKSECRASNLELVLAAYNAGEGNVSKWLKDKRFSKDGKSLSNIPYRETANYLKRVMRFKRIYNQRL